MKTFRFDFTGGVNNVGDKSIIANRFLTFADNVDLRSGSILPFKEPIEKVAATAGTTRLWEHKGNFYQSALWRDYAAVTSNNVDIIYYSEQGGTPKKMVGDITVNLGVIAPKTAPFAMENNALCPVVRALQKDGGGSLLAGTTKSYRVAVETTEGIQPPGAPASVSLSGVYPAATTVSVSSWNSIGQAMTSTQSVAKDQPRMDLAVDVSWSAVQGAVKYHIFSGAPGQERLTASLAAGSTYNWRDTGSVAGDGELATVYEASQPTQYISTFTRIVGPTESESGPSPASRQISSRLGRKVTFDLNADGYFSQSGTVTLTPTASDSTATNSWEWELDTATAANLRDHTKLTLKTAVSLPAQGMKVRFAGTGDVAWDSYKFEVFPDLLDNKVVYVKDATPLASVTSGSKMFLEAATATFAAAHGLLVGDALLVTVGGVSTVCPVVKVDSTVKITYGGYLATDDTVTSIKATTSTYLKYRNLYRTSSSGMFQLVKQLPISTIEYYDDMPEEGLGSKPTSYYDDNGIQVIFAQPPSGLSGLTEHYGMLFGIDGKRVRWTPIGQPDAWPDNFYEEGFGSRPLALASFSQSLIVLCEDAIYRIDGNTPTSLSLTRTLAEDGCIAPRAILKTTDAGLLYVGRRGVMAFDGMHAQCLTDAKVDRHIWSSTSKMYLTSGHTSHHQVVPLRSFNYASMTNSEPNLATVKESNHNFTNNDSPYIVMEMRAFYNDGKAYFFWDDRNGQTEAHTCVVLDIKTPGAPITTLGLKIKDVAISATENVYFLINRVGDLEQSFIGQAATLGTTQPSSASPVAYIYEAFKGDNLPVHVRTGANPCGAPTELKRFRAVEFHGQQYEGTLRVRIWIDGRYVCDGQAVVSEHPTRHRRVNIPVRRCIGNTIDVELAGLCKPRAIEVHFDPYEGEVE